MIESLFATGDIMWEGEEVPVELEFIGRGIDKSL